MRRVSLLAVAAFAISGPAARAQQYLMSTVAGGSAPPLTMAAASASIGAPVGLATDASSNVYFTGANCVFKLDTNGVVTRIAGNGRWEYTGDGGPAINAGLYLNFDEEQGLAADNAGNIYIADTGNNVIRKISANGIITTVAGNGTPGYSGDGGLATQARLNFPWGVASDNAGGLYIADSNNHAIRRVSSRGIISTVAGTGSPGYLGDGGPAASAALDDPQAVTVDAAGDLFIADSGNNRIRKVATGTITTIAGDGTPGFSGDGGPAVNAALYFPVGLAFDSAGNLYFDDNNNIRIRKVSVAGIITTVAGNGSIGYAGDGGPATSAQLNSQSGVGLDGAGNLYIADTLNSRIRKVSPAGTISTAAGNGKLSFSNDGGLGTSLQLVRPTAVALDNTGNLYFSDTYNGRVCKVSSAGIVTTVAGNSTLGFSGDGGPATSAQLNLDFGLAVDGTGNLYIGEESNYRVRKVAPNGTVTTVAGTGVPGFSGDFGPATQAQLGQIGGVAVDSTGNLYIADLTNNRVRKVSTSGIITTVAGSGGAGFSGDGGPATDARLYFPEYIAVDTPGNLYIGDRNNNRIRKVTTDGTISTVAGTGVAGYSGDGGPATRAQLNEPFGIAVDAAGNLYISDGANDVIRKVATDGTIGTVAGHGFPTYTTDSGPAVAVGINIPFGLAVDRAGNVYVADIGNNEVRMMQPVTPTLNAAAITNGASNLQGQIASEEIVVLYGSGIGPSPVTPFQLNSAGTVPTILAGTEVLFNGILAPLLYTSATQVAAIVPAELGLSALSATLLGEPSPSVQIQVWYQNQVSNTITIPQLGFASPGIFSLDSSGKGQAAAVNQDGTPNSASNPAPVGSVISLWATGAGLMTPLEADGAITQPPVHKTIYPVTAKIGGVTAQVQYAGAAPGEVNGVVQVNAVIPAGVQPRSAVPVVLSVEGATSQSGITIAVAGQ